MGNILTLLFILMPLPLEGMGQQTKPQSHVDLMYEALDLHIKELILETESTNLNKEMEECGKQLADLSKKMSELGKLKPQESEQGMSKLKKEVAVVDMRLESIAQKNRALKKRQEELELGKSQLRKKIREWEARRYAGGLFSFVQK